MEMIGRVVLLAKERGFAALASFLEGRFAELEALAEELRITAGRQSGAHRAFRQEAVRRGAASAALHEWMADVAFVARSLPAGQAPGAAERFRMPRSQSYQAQQATAKAFIKALRELQATFAERGLDEEAIAQAEALLEQIEQANGAKNSRYLRRIESTAKLMLTSRRALAVVREIDAILQRKLRATPALLAEWNFARHVHRPWKKRSAQPAGSMIPEVSGKAHAEREIPRDAATLEVDLESTPRSEATAPKPEGAPGCGALLHSGLPGADERT